MAEMKTAEHILQKRNVRIISVSEGLHLDPAVVSSHSARAEFEGDQIVSRTKKGVAAAKAKGVVFGNPNIDKVRPLACEANKRRALEKAAEIAEAIQQNAWQKLTATQLANALNSIGLTTRRNKPWTMERLRDPLKLAKKLMRSSRHDTLDSHPLYGRF